MFARRGWRLVPGAGAEEESQRRERKRNACTRGGKKKKEKKQTEAARLDARRAEAKEGNTGGSCPRLFYRLKEITRAEPRVASKPLHSLYLVAAD